MAGNVTGLHVFANDVSPEPLANLDTNYTALSNAVNSLSSYANYYVDTGAVNALTIAVTAAQLVALTDGLILDIKVNNTTTSTTPTLNVAGLGAQTIVDNFGNPLALGALRAGFRYRFIYDGANFRVQNPDTLLAAFKTALTGRTNTAALANDPDLQCAITALVPYVFEFYLIPSYAPTSANGGLAFQVAYSAGFSAGTFATYGVAGGAFFVPGPLRFALNTSITWVSSANSLVSDWILVKGSFLPTAAGTFSLQWAQNTATNANTTSINAGSYFYLKPL